MKVTSTQLLGMLFQAEQIGKNLKDGADVNAVRALVDDIGYFVRGSADQLRSSTETIQRLRVSFGGLGAGAMHLFRLKQLELEGCTWGDSKMSPVAKEAEQCLVLAAEYVRRPNCEPDWYEPEFRALAAEYKLGVWRDERGMLKARIKAGMRPVDEMNEIGRKFALLAARGFGDGSKAIDYES